MVGYWVGRDRSGAHRYGRWVLARKEDDLEKAKVWLDHMRKPNALFGDATPGSAMLN